MIVRSLRLKNIKSYGEGPDGAGVTISLEAGANRIAGKNGHGKTTLIESLGYALFLTEPLFEENFQLETYFLRTGKRAAEIDVTFSHRGELYRIERGLGPDSKRQAKVVQVEDGSNCAEGNKEVSAFLCRLFGLPNPKRFSELFWKLIGVRQGRLTWPFDSKPGAAKEFFEPLLDVAVFRECFQSLKPAVEEFEARRHEQEKVRATVEERIRERDDSVAMLKAKRLQFCEIELRLEYLNKARLEIAESLARLEAAQLSLRAAELQRNIVQNAVELARQQREIADQRMGESAEAGGVVSLVQSGFNAYGETEKELQLLRAKQTEQRRIEMEIAEAEKRKIEFDEKSKAALSQTEFFGRQKQGKETELINIREQVGVLRNRLSGSQAEFEKQKNLANAATHHLADIRSFLNSFVALLAHGGTTLSEMKGMKAFLGTGDPSTLQISERQEEAAGEALQSLRQQLAAANAGRAAFQKQLQEIRGGLCPFLSEQCRQFDPSKVEGDLKERSATIEILERKTEVAESVLRRAQNEHQQQRKEEQILARKNTQLEQMVTDFLSVFERLTWDTTLEAANGLRRWIREVQPMPECANRSAKAIDAAAFESVHRQNADYLRESETWWKRTETVVRARIIAVQEEEKRRNSDQRDEVNCLERLHRIESEIAELKGAETEQREAAAAWQRKSADHEEIISALKQLHRAFGFLDDEISLLEQTQQRHLGDYQRYLGAKPLADERDSRQIERNARKEQEERAIVELRLCEAKFSELSRGFDEIELGAARRKFEEITAAKERESVNLENAWRETEREEVRFREWQEACAKRDEIDRVVQRLAAAVKLTELARVVLRDSAPMVAQQLCDRIAGQAQRIFNRINHDPVELRWEAAPRYSLRVTPGDRRFAMLSGGEQTKLALAMTLAMIQEFSGLRFCIFDEPTYGVDAESRDKLGDALLESQKAAELEQLILVSHDDAFDGKIEHSIFLRKTATYGTEVVQFSRPAVSPKSQNSVASRA